MTNQELQELRRWSAEDLMGWTAFSYPPHGLCYMDSKFHPIMRVEDWRPYDATTGQIWMCWNKVRQTQNIVLGAKGKIHFCEIREKSYPVPMDSHYAEADTPCDAIIKAAYVAWRSNK
jgi:hypothetical protein